MLTGQLPFKGDYEPAMVYSILPPITAGTMKFGKFRRKGVMPFGLQLTPMESVHSNLLTASGFIIRNKRNSAFGGRPFRVGKNQLSWNFRSEAGRHGP